MYLASTFDGSNAFSSSDTATTTPFVVPMFFLASCFRPAPDAAGVEARASTRYSRGMEAPRHRRGRPDHRPHHRAPRTPRARHHRLDRLPPPQAPDHVRLDGRLARRLRSRLALRL